MIHLPRRSVTRFFIPLIDVMILLFCIFLLLPVFKENDPENPDANLKKKLKDREDEVKRLRAVLAESGRDLRPFNERYAIRVLEIDPKNGQLVFYSGNPPRRRVIGSATAARELVQEHELQVAAQALGKPPELRYLLLWPRVDSAFPTNEQLRDYRAWFQKVPLSIEKPPG